MSFPTVDYLPVATAAGANVDSQATFVGSGYQTTGFQNGLAIPSQINKALRQSSVMSAAIANFISAILSINILDDGNVANLQANFLSALQTIVGTVVNSRCTQAVVTGSRALATVYQNNTGKPMLVTVSASQNNGGYPISAYSDNNAAPTTLVAEVNVNGGAAAPGTLTFCVLPGNYYKINEAAGAIACWTEWTL